MHQKHLAAGLCPDRWGAYSAPLTLYLCLRVGTREEKGGRWEKEGTGERGEEGRNRGVKGGKGVKKGRQGEDGKSHPRGHF